MDRLPAPRRTASRNCTCCPPTSVTPARSPPTSSTRSAPARRAGARTRPGWRTRRGSPSRAGTAPRTAAGRGEGTAAADHHVCTSGWTTSVSSDRRPHAFVLEPLRTSPPGAGHLRRPRGRGGQLDPGGRAAVRRRPRHPRTPTCTGMCTHVRPTAPTAPGDSRPGRGGRPAACPTAAPSLPRRPSSARTAGFRRPQRGALGGRGGRPRRRRPRSPTRKHRPHPGRRPADGRRRRGAGRDPRRGAQELVRVPLAGGEPEVLLGGPRTVPGAAATAGRSSPPRGRGQRRRGLRPAGGDRTLTGFGAELTAAGATSAAGGAHRHRAGRLPRARLAGPARPAAFPGRVRCAGHPRRPVTPSTAGRCSTRPRCTPGPATRSCSATRAAPPATARARPRRSGTRWAPSTPTTCWPCSTPRWPAEGLDRHRVGVMGGSYGGFMTAGWPRTPAHRFRAAIVERAVTSWDSFTGSSDIGYFFAEAYAGADPEAVAAQSPLSHVDKIDLPALIIHSEQDWRCPVEQAQRLVRRAENSRGGDRAAAVPGGGARAVPVRPAEPPGGPIRGDPRLVGTAPGLT